MVMEDDYNSEMYDEIPGEFLQEQLAPTAESLPTLADLSEDSSSPGVAREYIEDAEWHCMTPGNISGSLEWMDQISGLLNGMVKRQYSAVLLSHVHNEWFAQTHMKDNQIPYVELGMRIDNTYNQVFRFSSLHGAGMRILDVLEIIESYVRDEAFPPAGKYRLDVFYY